VRSVSLCCACCVPSYSRTHWSTCLWFPYQSSYQQNLMCVCVYMLMDAHTHTLSSLSSLSHTHTTQVLVLGAWWRVCLASSAGASLCKVDYIRLNTKIEIFCSVFKSVMSIRHKTRQTGMLYLPLSVSFSSLFLFSLSLALSLLHTHTLRRT
jgi:putative exporter of polyketide antibiotics